jgi:hypothetical protein
VFLLLMKVQQVFFIYPWDFSRHYVFVVDWHYVLLLIKLQQFFGHHVLILIKLEKLFVLFFLVANQVVTSLWALCC